MSAADSHLSSSDYGYDFVMSTTQKAMSNLMERFMDEGGVEDGCWYFFGKDVYDRSDALKKTGGIDPLDSTQCPDTMKTSDPNYEILHKAGFSFACKYTIGIPGRVESLPPAVTLNKGGKNVFFNVFFDNIAVVHARGDGGTLLWNRSAQQPGSPWYITTENSIVSQSWQNLRDIAYYKTHEHLAEEIEGRVTRVGNASCSFQQITLDWKSFVVKHIESKGALVETKDQTACSLRHAATKLAEAGLPPLCVLGTTKQSGLATPLVTSSDWQISDYQGDPSASTLDVICMASDKGMPSPPHRDFAWHWMEPGDDRSGITSVNSKLLAEHLKTGLITKIEENYCNIIKCNVQSKSSLKMSWSPDPTSLHTEVFPAQNVLLRFNFQSKDSQFRYGVLLSNKYQYNLDITAEKKSLKVSQFFYSSGEISYAGGVAPYIIAMKVEDTYAMSVGDDGNLQVEHVGDTHKSDDTKDFRPSQRWDRTFADTASQSMIDFHKQVKDKIIDAILQPVAVSQLSNFVFPGGQVFTFENPIMSDWADLLCPITYTDPTILEDPVQPHKTKPQTNPLPTLKYSSELMQNYIHGEIVSPTGKFRALQTADGHSLVFAVSSSGILRVFEERGGPTKQATDTKTGWRVMEISPKDALVTQFDVNQKANDGTISLAMSVNHGGEEILHISLGNSNSDLNWIDSPSWIPLKFDAGQMLSSLNIAGIFFAESPNGERLVVDLDRPELSTKHIERYYVDPTPGPQHWTKHHLPVDIARDNYQSCIGRVSGAKEDGVYTSGTVIGSASNAQLVYLELERPGRPKPLVRRLYLPDGDPTQLMLPVATIRNDNQSFQLVDSTDLYAVGNSTLYRWPANGQRDRAKAKCLMKHDIFSGTDTLLSMAHRKTATIWGLNASKQLYYLSCPRDKVGEPGCWSAPTAILYEIEHVSTYVNAKDGGNTIFAYGDGKVVKLTKETSGAGLWKAQEIILPPSEARQSAKPILSHTTTVAISKSGQPAVGCTVSLSTKSRTPVYINGLYYVISDVPIHVPADDTGIVTVVEATENLNAAELTVSVEGYLANTIIKPSDAACQKFYTLDSIGKLKAAQIPVELIAGGVVKGTDYKPLVKESTTETELKNTVAYITAIKHMYANSSGLQAEDSDHDSHIVPATPYVKSSLKFNVDNSWWSDAGDWFRRGWEAVKHGVKVLVNWVWDGIKKAWHFFQQIGEEVYETILDTVDAVIGGVEWVIHQIVEFAEDVIRYVQVLFEWDDIARTKNVFHSVMAVWLNHQVDEIPKAQEFLDVNIDTLVKEIDEWSTCPHDWGALGDVAKKPAKDSSKNPMDGQTSSSSLLLKHFQTHFQELTPRSAEPWPQIPESVFEGIDATLAGHNADDSIKDMYEKLCALAHDFKDLSVGAILKRLVGILTGAVLRAAKAVIDIVLGILAKIAKSAVKLLDTKIHIPVISDILNALGVDDISLLDLFMWIAAVAYTVAYKLSHHNSAPFTEAFAGSIASASSWQDFIKLFPSKATTYAVATTTSIDIDVAAMFHGGHAGAGIVGIVAAILHTAEAAMPAKASKLISYSSIAASVICAGLTGVTNFVVPRCGIKSKQISELSTLQTGWTVGWALAFGVVGDKLTEDVAVTTGVGFLDARAAGAVVQAVLTIPAFIVTGYHFYELSQDTKGSERDEAIIGEVSSLTGGISKLAYAIAVNIPEDVDPVKLTALATIAVSDTATAGLQIAEASLDYQQWRP